MPEYMANKIKRPRAVEKPVQNISLSEQKKLELAALSSPKDKLRGVVLCLYSGLQIGELLFLTWSDVNIEKGILSVTKTCHGASVHGKHVRLSKLPKRQNPLPKMLLKLLKEMKSKCKFVIADGTKSIFVRSYQ